jgi:hypothetical protein
LLQLVAVGTQDKHLTGNPQITFFRTTCLRHSNFAIESIPQQMIGNTMPGRRATCSLSRNGDLVSSIMVEITVPPLKLKNQTEVDDIKWIDNLGHFIMEQMTIEIGGQRVDTQTSDFLNVIQQLTMPDSKELGYDCMVRGPTANKETATTTDGSTSRSPAPASDAEFKGIIPGFKMFVPLRFWFNNKNYANALPLLALQYHEVKVSIDFADLYKLVVEVASDGTMSSVPGGTSCSPPRGTYEIDTGCFDAELYVDYIYLDTAERKKMATATHEYLIEQCQFTGVETINKGCNQSRFRLNFNHPVKALIWIAQNQDDVDPNNYVDIVDEAKLLLNGHDRFSSRPGKYFSLYQPYQHWPRVPHTTDACNKDASHIPIYTYSFALQPASHMASGTANFSRIDSAQLEIVCNQDVMKGDTEDENGKFPEYSFDVKIFAINYNMLRIMGGLGGLAYSS